MCQPFEHSGYRMYIPF